MFLKRIITYLCVAGLAASLSACGSKKGNASAAATDAMPAATGMVKYPEKGEMRLLTDRPPQLETPLEVFKKDITPNEFFFVRWHLAEIVRRIDEDTFRLRIGGAVAHPLELSMNDLRTKFPADSMVALCICSGNSRASFDPKVPGSQWGNGAMGNAKWKGVRVKDILAMAGVQKGAVDVSFAGMDKGTLPGVPGFTKSLSIDHATDGEVLIAYEMNGTPIPMLNGYPLKLVVPGWYASYWVGALGNIEVHKEKYKGFWMEKAYRIANTPGRTERPDSLVKETIPLTTVQLHSIFVSPTGAEPLKAGQKYTLEGLTFNDGSGISRVEVSADGGKTWAAATMDPEIGKYSWRRWKHEWTPATTGSYDLAVRATDSKGNTQPEKQWNRSGYARGFIEHIKVQAQ
ncbi:molybdopterin-dependent oxidoreductase [Nemorincola caseinilytica]